METLIFDHPILAIESSCDETSAAVVHGRKVLSNIVATQMEMHEKWGGVVPEAAARAHVSAVLPVIQEALDVAKVSIKDIKGIAVTNRPGLVGALSVGVSAAQALAIANQIPLVGIDHLEGHLMAILSLEQELNFPCVSLLVSGGHSELVLIHEQGKYQLLGETRDDAAGEAFDKGARLLGLGYPGGAKIQAAAETGNPRRYSLPKGMEKARYEMSFSGLKTAMLRLVESEGERISIPDAAASLQYAICSALTRRVENAIQDHQPSSISLCGGVAANRSLRKQMLDIAQRHGIECYLPDFSLCTDNAAMVGLAAQCYFSKKRESVPLVSVFPHSELFTFDN